MRMSFNWIDSDEDEPIEIASEMVERNNEQRKSNAVPTLMITVKNEMAQANNDKTTTESGKIKPCCLFRNWKFDCFFFIYFQDPAETATLRHIFSDAAYFLIKSRNEENISLAKSKVRLYFFFPTDSIVFICSFKGVWSTPPANENKLNQAYRVNLDWNSFFFIWYKITCFLFSFVIQEHRNVILIFSVAESKGFQGFARMSGEARHDNEPIQWILPPGMNNRSFSGVIDIDWITR